MSLLALLFASFLMSLGGAGAAAAYFQKNPSDFMAELRSYLAANIDTEELAPLDVTPTPIPTPSVTPTPTVSPTPTPTPAPDEEEDEEDDHHDEQEEEHEDEEKFRESMSVKYHENGGGEMFKLKLRVRATEENED